jgi:uncharacterized membrane protein YdjX (TVP38/TMEM64 family)
MSHYQNIKRKKDIDIFDENETDNFRISIKSSPKGTLNIGKASWTKSLLIFLLIAAVSLLFYFFLYRNGEFGELIEKGATSLQGLYRDRPYIFGLVVYSIIVMIMVLCLGFHAMFCIFTASIIKNFWVSFGLLLFSSVSGDLCAYLISKYTCKLWLISKFNKNDLYNLLAEESKKEPFKTAFLTRFIFMPAGMKNYILSLIQNPFMSYFLSGSILHAFYVAESCLIAQEISEFSHMSDSNKGWEQKSWIQKFSFIMVLSLIIFTIIFIALVGVWATRSLKEKRASREMQTKDYKN